MSAKHLLVTNDFPPKIGGIQNYLWELWRRLTPDSFIVYTTPYKESNKFDNEQNFRIIRSKEPWLAPYPWMPGRIKKICEDNGISHVIYDPAWPLGIVAKKVGLPYGIVLHGAEVTIPARLPISKQMIRRTLKGSSLVISAGNYPLQEANKCIKSQLKSVVIPPGVDTKRFKPINEDKKLKVRQKYGVSDNQILISAVSRLVPRKGFLNLISAVDDIKDEFNIQLLIGGTGREREKLLKKIDHLDAPVKLLGRISDIDLVELYAASDIMAMVCNERWFGLEQEGFGIVFLEAAACGVPQIAGRSGGSHEAVLANQTGLIVDKPNSVPEITKSLKILCDDPIFRSQMGKSARERSLKFDYDNLSIKLENSLQKWIT